MTDDAASFPTQTAWSTILAARDRNSPEWQRRVETLVRRYWRPVQGYLIRQWRCSREDAADLTQEFFARLFDRDGLDEASPERGRFRTFLKLKLRSLVIDDLRRKTAQKRGGGARFVPIGGDEAGPDPQWPGLSPEEEFDRVWAGHLIAQSLKELEQKLRAEGKEKVFEAFRRCAIESPPQCATECAAALRISESAVHNYVFRSRRELRDILFGHVRESVEREGEIEQELSSLLRLLGP